MKPTFHLITYGCQMNKSDSERIAGVLKNANFSKSNLATANYVILNLCAVRQKAVDRVWGEINQIKKENAQAKIVLTGCILPADKKKLAPKVDFILNIDKLQNWPDLLKKNQSAKQISNPLANKKITSWKKYLEVAPQHDSNFEAFVPIMTGCNNFCSYCAVPYTRGREKSRPVKNILTEVNKLVSQGYKFITLLGQNVNSYQGELNFPKLLKKIDQIPGNYWLSFVTSHPKDMSDELINCFKTCQHLIPYLHLPIQSGANKILKLMNRQYSASDYLALIKKIKKTNPQINLSTDIIVGFPGETNKDFAETVKLMKKIKYDMAYIAQYSPRPNTSAFKLDDNISSAEKKRRANILNEVLKKTALAKNKKMIKQNIEVLVENKKDNYYLGKTKNFKNIKIKTSQPNLVGKFVRVEIKTVSEWNLQGELIR